MRGTKISRRDLLKIMIMRSLGYNHREIGKKINKTQSTIQYHLAKLKKESQERGINNMFFSMVIEMMTDKISGILKAITTDKEEL